MADLTDVIIDGDPYDEDEQGGWEALINDTLSKFVNLSDGLSPAYTGDLDDIAEISCYNCNGDGGVLHAPEARWGFVSTYIHCYSTAYRSQVWITMPNGDYDPEIYTRARTGSTWTTWRKMASSAFAGATASADGVSGTVPQPHAGDQDKVLQGNGSWGKKLQIDVVIQNGVYGYIGANNTFIPFKSQADIDAAVSAAKVGNATAADVLSGKTFTNSTTSGVTGTMPNRKTNSMIVPRWGTDPGSNVPATQIATRNPRVNFENSDTYGSKEMVEIAMPAGCYAWSYGHSSCCIPTETKSVTPSTSSQTVSPTEYNTKSKYVKFLKQVTVNAIPNQRDASGQAAGNKCWTWNNRVYFGFDYGWYPSGNSYGSMSNVCERYVDYSKVASALGITGSTVRAGSTIIGVSGTAQDGIYNVTGHGTKLDMGANNTYRYVNTQKAYDAGYAAGRAQGRADTQGGVCIQIRVQNGSGATITAGWRWASEDWHTIRDGKSWSISGTDAYVAKSYKVRYNSPPMIPE